MSCRIQIIGDDVFFDGELVAKLRPGIPTSNHIAFREFLEENEYQDDDASPNIFDPPVTVRKREPASWQGLARR